ncbi:hypothetical protein SAMN02799625_06023 [Methylobacterium sp. UNC300MFChir4.1]|uniref:hypothetical protein n=1 Tax=Methylobacterium sp. UNC300MFChir4.1 TaxID=1502747 RepID=UPI0008AAC310|nr:hypothetical protein [Methylobacterium sp. UNC300MFChir4.1]SEP40991.1 hypothetical protein SAMN02799625_06023 [Methylobacterium sp. UNC300MFChir4.1]
MRTILIPLAVMVSGQALAFDATNAHRNNSSDMYRPTVGDMMLRNPNALGLLPGSNSTAYSLSTLLRFSLPKVQTNAELKALAVPYPNVRRLGFSAPGDGGVADYSWSAQNCSTPDDGAQVQPSGRAGCWIADIAGPAADVRIWGARQGQVIDGPLKAAIAWACTSHMPLVMPYAYERGQYLVGSQITIGNGSAAAYSTCNNVSLELVGNYAVTTAGTLPPLGMPIRYTGSSNGSIPFVAQGPATMIRLKGLGIDCNNLCATGIKVSNILDGKFEDLSVEHQVGPAFIVTSETANALFSSQEGSRFANIHADFPSAGGSGMRIGSIDCTVCNYGVLGNIFENMTFNYDGSASGTFGLEFGMASQNTFTNVRTTPFFIGSATPGNQGYSIKISPPPGAPLYPTANTFLSPIIAGRVDPGPAASGWGAPFGGFHFLSWSTVYQPFPTPTVPGRFTGTDTAGGIFSTSSAPGTWTPRDGSGAGLSLNVQDAQWTQVGKVCTVTFALTYPTTASNAVASLAGLPCSVQFGMQSRAGGAPSYTDFGNPFTILISDGTPTANFYTFAGAGLTNSQLSGKSIRATLTYMAN